MIDIKYNPFIVCVLTNNKEYLFNSEDTLLYPVPFGNYKIGEYLSEEEFEAFSKLMDEYIDKHNLKVIKREFTDAYDCTYVYEYIFTFNEKYYKVDVETIEGSIHGEINHVSWINNNLENYEVYPKTITKIIYEYKN